MNTISVRVREGPSKLQRVFISPPYFSGVVGDQIVLKCEGEGPQRSITWSRRDGSLPYNARDEAGVLTVYDAKLEDSGVFVCTIVNSAGISGYGNATVAIRQGDG